jgi:hypothetical protein
MDGIAMEPDLTTAPVPGAILKELASREPIFHRPAHGATRADFENMTLSDFWEVGASGRRYSREYVMAELERRAREPVEEIWATSDFQCRGLAPDVYLLTYTLLQNNERKTRRST